MRTLLPGKNRALDKTILLASLLPRRPIEFYRRVRTFWEVKLERLLIRPPQYKAQAWEEVVREIGMLLGTNIEAHLSENSLEEIAEEVRQQAREQLYRARDKMTQ